MKNGLSENVPFHRRRRSFLAVLLVIAIVVVIVVGISFGPYIPMHPVNPGGEISPPPENTTTPTPSTTNTNQGNIDYLEAINIPAQTVTLEPF